MNCWERLQIAPTASKEDITAAYRTLLVTANPEDSPEAFQQLRAAYEEALRWNPDAQAKAAQTPLDTWLVRTQALYEDFARRCNPTCWAQLLGDEVCTRLDTKLSARTALLRFLMEHYRLPRAVWQVLEAHFDLLENRAELYESFPQDFIDYAVINGIKYDPILPYDLFEPSRSGAQYDTYISLYLRTRNALEESDTEQAQRLMDEMAQTGVSHPFQALQEVRLLVLCQKREEARALAAAAAAKHPAVSEFVLLHADLERLCENWTVAQPLYKNLLEREPQHYAAKYGLAACALEHGAPQAAKELLQSLIVLDPADQQVLRLLETANERLLETLAAKERAEALTQAERLTLTWCYLHKQAMTQAEDSAQLLHKEEIEPFDYENLMGKLHFQQEHYAQAAQHLHAWEQILRTLPAEDAQTPERRARIPEALRLQVVCLLHTDDAQARALLHTARAEYPHSAELMLEHIQLLCSDNAWGEGLALCDTLLEQHPGQLGAQFLRGRALFSLEDYPRAYQAFQSAIERDPSDLRNYLYKLRILLRLEEWDAAKEVIALLEQHNISCDTLRYCRARLLQHEERYAEAEALLQEVVQHRESGSTEIDFMCEVFYVLALVRDRRDAEDADPEELLALVERGLAQEPGAVMPLGFQAFLLEKLERWPEASAVYHKLLAAVPRHRSAHYDLAFLQYHYFHRYEDALRLCEAQNAIAELPDAYKIACLCCCALRRFPQAEEHIRRALALGETPALYCNLADVYWAQNRFADAQTQLQRAFALAKEQETPPAYLYRELCRLYTALDRYDAALTVCNDCIAAFDQPQDHLRRMRLHLRFGRLEAAMRALEDWRKCTGESSGSEAHSFYKAEVLCAQKRLFAAVHTCRKATNSILGKRRLARLLCYQENHTKALSILQECLRNAPQDGELLDQLAHTAWHAGNTEQARAYARQTLPYNEQNYAQNKGEEGMYLTRKAQLLLILGDFAQAQQLLDAARRCPLCEHCSYRYCKDADLVQVMLYEARGEAMAALTLYQNSMARCPDEMDFYYGCAMLQKKMLRRR